eukprot:114901-Hanusia_phi.AAC.1
MAAKPSASNMKDDRRHGGGTEEASLGQRGGGEGRKGLTLLGGAELPRGDRPDPEALRASGDRDQ